MVRPADQEVTIEKSLFPAVSKGGDVPHHRGTQGETLSKSAGRGRRGSLYWWFLRVRRDEAG